ncbi:fibronectin type III domain-containing protein [Pseudarthrobacter sp. YS3]|uniref:fibronectin type III domain-containing protein n=1 Tax=Pseudarthrobacter sp. YS3 TaxID=3453718 RepID=UPI003EECA13B
MGILDVPFNPSSFVPRWKANTAYLAGSLVVAPTGETVSAKVGFTSGSTFSAANWNFPATGGGSVTFTTLTSAGQVISLASTGVVGLALVQDATGSRTVTWPAGIRWAGGTVPTLSTGGGATDLFTFVALTGGGWLGKQEGSFASPSDITPPSAVTGLAAGTVSATSVPLSWTAATDNIAVTGYEYSTNGTTYTSTGSTGTSYTVTGLTSGTAYTLSVRAFDAAGNRGTAASVAVTTSATGYTAGQVITSDSFNRADTANINGSATDIASGGSAITWVATGGIGITTNQLVPGTNGTAQTAKLVLPAATARLKASVNLAALPAGGNLEIQFFSGATVKTVLRIAAGAATMYKEGYGNLGAWTAGTGLTTITLDGTAISATGFDNVAAAKSLSGVGAGGNIDNVIVSTAASVTSWKLDDLIVSVPA